MIRYLLAMVLLGQTACLAQDSAKKSPLTGIVVDDEGKPVADANVLVRVPRSLRTKTDAEGKFHYKDVAHGTYLVYASKGHTIARLKSFEHKQEGDAAKLTLSRGIEVEITAISESTGEAVADAIVRLRYPFRREIKTNAQGIAKVGGLLPSLTEFRLYKKGLARAVREVPLDQTSAPKAFTLKMKEGGVLNGKVVDEKGEPIQKAMVYFRLLDYQTGTYDTSPYTDEEGKFRNRYLPLGVPIEVDASADGYVSVDKEFSISPDTRQRDVVITLKRKPHGGTVLGTVRDEAGNPIAGAKAINSGRRFSQRREAVTDQDGKFQLDELYGKYSGFEVVVGAKGYAAARLNIEPNKEGTPVQRDVVLKKGHTLKGRLVTEQGKPISQAWITSRDAISADSIGVRGRSNADGYFEIDSLPESCKFEVSAAGFSDIVPTKWEFDTEEPIEIVMKPMGILRGQVTDKISGMPIESFRVQIGFSEIRQPDDVRGSYSSRLGNPGVDFDSKDGVFSIDQLNHGMPFEVRIFADGYQREVVRRMVATNDQDAPMPKIELTKMDPASQYTLRGTMLDFEQKPIVGAQLRLIVTDEFVGDSNDFNWILVLTGQIARRGRCEQFLIGVTDSKGKFEFKGILPDKYLQLAIWGDKTPRGRYFLDDPSKAGETYELTATLPEPSTIKVSVDEEAIANLGGVALDIKDQSWHRYEINAAKGQSEFLFETLPPGEYSVALQGKPERAGENSYRVKSLGQKNITVFPGDAHEIKFSKADLVAQEE